MRFHKKALVYACLGTLLALLSSSFVADPMAHHRSIAVPGVLVLFFIIFAGVLTVRGLAPSSVAGGMMVAQEQPVVSDDAGDLSTSSLQGVAPISQYGMCDAPFKMILAVNMSLKMGNGKIAAQCGHATLGCYCKSIKASPTAVGWWERLGQAKIAVKIADENEMFVIRDAADAAGLVTHIVVDAGHTQIAAGSRTVLAIGPAPVSVLNHITGHLKLL